MTLKQNIKDNKKLLSNIIYSGFFQGLNWLVPLLTTPFLIKTIGIDKFGVVSFSLIFFSYMFAITDYGFNISATRLIALNRDNNQYLSRLFTEVMAVKLFLCLIVFLVVLFLTSVSHKFQAHKLLYLYGFLVVIGRALFPNWYFQGLEEMKIIAILNFIAQVFFLIFILIFIKKTSDYIYIIFIQGIMTIIVSIIGLSIVYKNLSYLKPSYLNIIKLIREGFYPFLSSASIIGYTRFNFIILGLMANDTIIGYYSAVDKIIYLIRQIMGTVCVAVYPKVCYLTTMVMIK